MALGSSVYKLVFDTQGLNNVTASRRELALKKQIMQETATVAEKLTVAEANLDRMVSKTLITNEQKIATLDKLRKEFRDTDGIDQQVAGLHRMAMAQATGVPLIGQLVAGFEAAGPAGVAAAAAFTGISVAVNLTGAAIRTTIDNVTEQIDKIDKLIAASETINVPVDQFQRLAQAANYANIEQSQFASGTEKMLVGISKGADGSKKLVDAFNIIGLEAGKLRDMQPDKAFAKITSALDRVPNAADKARAATAIFGSADFLRINTEHIERANKLMEQLRPPLNEVSAATFSEFDASVKDLNMSLDVTWQKVAMQIVPALTDAADAATELLIKANQNETLSDALQRSTDFARGFVTVAAEIPDHIGVMTRQVDAFVATHPKLLLMATVLEKIAGETADIGQQARLEKLAETRLTATELEKALGRELSTEEKATTKATGGPVAEDEDVSPIERETKAIQDLIDKLKEDVATKGMSTAMAKVWKLEQLNAGDEVIAKNRKLAEEYDALTKTEKAAKAVEAFTESLRHQGESAADSARRLADLKLANDGVDEATRKSLMAQYDMSEAQKAAIETQKKADAATKKHADAVVTLGESVQKEEAKLRGYTSAIGDNEARMRAGERAALEWQLTNDKADATTKAATLSIFDQSTALEKRSKATKTALEIQEDLTKKIRQTFMTDSEKKLDDAKLAGVSDEELKIIDTLQKELALREDIHKEVNATSGAIKAGSREAADAFAKANQIAVRERFLRNQITGAPVVTASTVPQLPAAQPAEPRFAAAAVPPKPVVTATVVPPEPSPVTATAISPAPVPPEPIASTGKPVTAEPIVTSTALPPAPVITSEPAITDPFEEAYRLSGKPNPLAKPIPAEIAPPRDLPVVTATPEPPEMDAGSPSTARFHNQAAEERRRQIREKRAADKDAAAEAFQQRPEQLAEQRLEKQERLQAKREAVNKNYQWGEPDVLARSLVKDRGISRVDEPTIARPEPLRTTNAPTRPTMPPQENQGQERILTEIAGLIRQLIGKTGVVTPEITDPTS